MKLSQHEINDLIERLQNDENLPEDYKYKLFPVKQKEYELVYGGKMRREDVLANEDGVFPVPLQIEKIFNGHREQWEDEWRNIIAFGDNLQFLKTVYEDKDSLIKNKIKGRIKLIYIDPPFGTGDEYDGNKGQRGYSAKSKGAEFVEFMRRRIIVAKELLNTEGVIVVRQAFNFSHYIKVILDEIFGKDHFINEIIIGRKREGAGSRNKFDVTNETLFFYSKTSDYKLNEIFGKRSLTDIKWTSFLMPGERKPRERTFFGVTLTPTKNQHFSLVQEKCDKLIKENFLRMRCIKCGARYYYAENDADLQKRLKHKSHKFKFYDINSDTVFFSAKKIDGCCLECKSEQLTVDYLGSDDARINNNWLDIRSYSSTTGYPTENSEELLERIISCTTNENDIIIDFFGGSGTTAAVAEKLNRKWITCDIGKLAFYTIQKRLLNIETSKSIEHPKKQHGKLAKSFITVNTGHYDLAKIFDLKQKEYSNFVMNLFEVAPKKKTISGIQIDGEKKDGYNVIVWQYWKFKNSSVDEDFLHNLHSHIGTKAGKRIYIIAPASYVDFISDYYEIEKVRYYFLKVPYQIIRELHKVQFKKFRQPQSKSNVNDLEDAIGFHFIRQPEVKSEIKEKSGEYHITISKFLSDFSEEETDKEMVNFESLAMILIDKDFDGETFDMDMCYFAEDLLPKKNKKTDEEESVENIKEGLKHLNQIIFPPIPRKECGNRLMLIYVDIYGNEFKEEFKLI